MWITGTLWGLVNLTPREDLTSYIWINLFVGVNSWKLGPRWVHGTVPWSQGLAGWPQGAQFHLKWSQKRRGEGLDSVLEEQTRVARLGAVAGCPWWHRVSPACPGCSRQGGWGWLSLQDLRLGGVMLPAWRGRLGGDRDIWWEFLTAELCVGLGCRVI